MSVAWVGVAVAAVGAGVKVHQANMAASKQRQAIADANSGLKTQEHQARDDYAPYRATGETATNALNGLMKDPSALAKDPSFGFEMGQGTQAVDRSAAGSGSLYSGATLKALQRYGTDYAGTKLNDAYTRYEGAANLGLSAVNGTTSSGQNAQNQISNNLIGAGNVTAAQDLANGTSISNGLNQMLASYTGKGVSPGTGTGTTTGGSQSSYSLADGRNGLANNVWGSYK